MNKSNQKKIIIGVIAVVVILTIFISNQQVIVKTSISGNGKVEVRSGSSVYEVQSSKPMIVDSHIFTPFTTLTLTAYPEPGWRLVRFQYSDGTSKDNPFSMTFTKDENVVVVFEQISIPYPQ